MEINLSEINVVPIKPRNGLLAFCSFVINDSFYIGDVAIYSRLNQEGYRLAYPNRTLANGLKINSFHPIRRDVAQSIEQQVIKVFLELAQKATMMKGVSRDEYTAATHYTPAVAEKRLRLCEAESPDKNSLRARLAE